MSKIIESSATIMCPHGASVSAVASLTRVTVANQAPLAKTDTCTVAGCPFTLPSGQPSPCVELEWQSATTRVKAEGKALLLGSSSGLCKAGTGAPQGSPNVVKTQTRVRAK